MKKIIKMYENYKNWKKLKRKDMKILKIKVNVLRVRSGGDSKVRI